MSNFGDVCFGMFLPKKWDGVNFTVHFSFAETWDILEVADRNTVEIWMHRLVTRHVARPAIQTNHKAYMTGKAGLASDWCHCAALRALGQVAWSKAFGLAALSILSDDLIQVVPSKIRCLKTRILRQNLPKVEVHLHTYSSCKESFVV